MELRGIPVERSVSKHKWDVRACHVVVASLVTGTPALTVLFEGTYRR